MKKGSKCMTQAQLDYIDRYYADGSNKDIARELGRTVESIRILACRRGLKKSPNALARGRAEAVIVKRERRGK